MSEKSPPELPIAQDGTSRLPVYPSYSVLINAKQKDCRFLN